MQVSSFSDLMDGHESAEIVCAIKGQVVRRLKVVGDDVLIDPMEGPEISIPLSTPIYYEAWVMDRGSLLFQLPEGIPGKICTELDLIRFEDHDEVIEV